MGKLDDISLKIIHELSNGTRVKDIPHKFDVSLDRAKRLSRYRNMLNLAKQHLPPEVVVKYQLLGMNVLALSPLFKASDWKGLTEIISSIDEHTKREDISVMIAALEEKRKRIIDLKMDINRKLEYLKAREQEVQGLEERVIETQLRIKEETAFLQKYPEQAQKFLINHLGLHENKLVLAKRLDSLWQKSLKKKGILHYDPIEYIWNLQDLDGLVNDYLSRINRKKPYPTEWNYEKEETRNRNGYFATPDNPYYSLPHGLAIDLQSELDEFENKMNEIEQEKREIQREMKQLKKKSPKSFIESIEATNTLSNYEIKIHGELQEQALKWLYNKGYSVASEVILPNNKRADVIGHNEQGHIIIIEVKASLEDFRRDQKWKTYLDYCDEFYFLLQTSAIPFFIRNEEYHNIGLLEVKKNAVTVRTVHSLEHTAKDRYRICFSISKALSKKYVFGY